MQKKVLVIFLVSAAMNAGKSTEHRLRTIQTQRKPQANQLFTASAQLALNTSVGMLQLRVARRTALLSEHGVRKCVKK